MNFQNTILLFRADDSTYVANNAWQVGDLQSVIVPYHRTNIPTMKWKLTLNRKTLYYKVIYGRFSFERYFLFWSFCQIYRYGRPRKTAGRVCFNKDRRRRLLKLTWVSTRILKSCPSIQLAQNDFCIPSPRITLQINLIIPTAVLAFVLTLTFVLPAESGERLGMSITLVLSQVVFMLVLAGMIPKSSENVPVVGRCRFFLLDKAQPLKLIKMCQT